MGGGHSTAVTGLTADKDNNRLNRAPERAHEIPGLLPVVYNSL